MNDGNNNGNNNQNKYDIYTSINPDAFNVFNTNLANTANMQQVNPNAQVNQTTTATQAGVVEAPVTTVPPTPPVVNTPQPQENMITVNDYKEPKEKFSIKNMLKKKMTEEEQTFDINAITNYTEEHKHVDTEEDLEEKKKKKDLIKLIILLVVLVVVGYIAFTIFSNYLKPTANTISNYPTTANNIKKEEVISYECDKPLDITFYNIPYGENIDPYSYKGNTIYTFKNDRLSSIKEEFTFKYSNIDEYKKDIIKYCNSFNAVYDQFQLICKYQFDRITITNNINMDNIEGKTIKNNVFTYKLIYNKHSIVGDILTNNRKCNLKEENK